MEAKGVTLEPWMEAMEDRLEQVMAKQHQLLYEKLTDSLQSLLRPEKEDRGLGGFGTFGEKRPGKCARSVDNAAIRNLLADVMPIGSGAPEKVEEEPSKRNSRGSWVQKTLSKASKKKSVPSLMALESAMLQGMGLPGGQRSSYRVSNRSESLEDQDGLPAGEPPQMKAICSDEERGRATLFGLPRIQGVNEVQVIPTNMQNLMKDSQSAILAEIDDACEDLDLDVGSRFLLAIPKSVPVALAVFSLLVTLTQLCMKLWYRLSHIYLFVIFCQVLYAVLASQCVTMLRVALRSHDLHLAVDRLHLFVADFQLDWGEVSGQEWRRYLLAWALLVSTQILALLLDFFLVEHPPDALSHAELVVLRVLGVIELLGFAASSGIVIAVGYVLSHLILGLDKALDCWCCHMVNTPHFEFGVQSWNNMQALLKCVGRELASCFLLVQVLAYAGFIYFLTNGVTYSFRSDLELLPTIVEGLAAIPLIFLFGLSMRLFSYGACLTEKCRTIPAFVNQIPREEGIDLDKQYLVDFITNSSAGFFVRDVKLTNEMFVKQFILVCGILSGLFGAASRMYM